VGLKELSSRHLNFVHISSVTNIFLLRLSICIPIKLKYPNDPSAKYLYFLFLKNWALNESDTIVCPL